LVMSKANVQHDFSIAHKLSVITNRIY